MEKKIKKVSWLRGGPAIPYSRCRTTQVPYVDCALEMR
jgi:hypothetical protein